MYSLLITVGSLFYYQHLQQASLTGLHDGSGSVPAADPVSRGWFFSRFTLGIQRVDSGELSACLARYIMEGIISDPWLH